MQLSSSGFLKVLLLLIQSNLATDCSLYHMQPLPRHVCSHVTPCVTPRHGALDPHAAAHVGPRPRPVSPRVAAAAFALLIGAWGRRARSPEKKDNIPPSCRGVLAELPQTTYRLPGRAPLQGSWYSYPPGNLEIGQFPIRDNGPVEEHFPNTNLEYQWFWGVPCLSTGEYIAALFEQLCVPHGKRCHLMSLVFVGFQ